MTPDPISALRSLAQRTIALCSGKALVVTINGKRLTELEELRGAAPTLARAVLVMLSKCDEMDRDAVAHDGALVRTSEIREAIRAAVEGF